MTELALLAEAGPKTDSLAMVAVYPRPEEAAALAIEGGQEPESLHVTLVFLGEAGDLDADRVTAAVARATTDLTSSLAGVVGGVGQFAEGEDGVPTILLPDVPGLTRLRERVVGALAESGVESPSEHGFLPHITVSYAAAELPEEIDLALGQELHFDAVSVVLAGERTDYPLGGAMSASTVTVTIQDGTATAMEPTTWQGVLAVEGIPTDDNIQTPRILMADSLSWRELPIPLMAQLETADGHTGARIAGQIQEVWRDQREDLGEGAVALMGRGTFDTSEFGQEVARLVREQTLRGISVDLVGTEWGLAVAENGELVEASDLDFEEMIDGKFLLALISGSIGAATVTPLQALADATIALVAASRSDARLGNTFGISLCSPLVAAAPRVVASSAFERPEAGEPTPLTLTDEGEVFGHAFLWETCHTGFGDQCRTAPISPSDYAYFHLGTVETAEGGEIAVGQITLDTGHADLRAGRAATRRHYDDTGVAVADVRMVDGVLGGWLSGALRDVPDEDRRKLKAAKLSGDWRQVNGHLELIGLLAVNVPGFPIPRAEARMVAAGGEEAEVRALVAAGISLEDDERADLLAELLEDPEELADLLVELSWPWLDDLRTYTAEQRRRYAKSGVAMGDGSFPIPDCSAAEDAIHSQGRTPEGNRGSVRAHIRKRVGSLGCSGGIFDGYR